MKQRLQRAWAFGRHIPPSKLARRARLSWQRRLNDRRGCQTLPRPQADLKAVLPQPVFPPRTPGQVWRDGDTLVFCFLGQEHRFGGGHIDWMAPGAEGAHQLWRMNLHYMEYLEEVDDRLFEQLVTAWLDANADLRPGAWRDGWNAYALSIRVVVWLQQMAARQTHISSDLQARMAESLARQMGYLAQNLETDIGGNHLAKNIKALLWAGAAFDGQAAQSWGDLGQSLLRHELHVQILPDGVHYERSASYHTQVFADFLECRAVLPAPLPELDAALTGMAQATADLTHPDGLTALFNDAGLHMAYAPGTCLDLYAAQGGARPKARPRFAFEDAGYFGYRDHRLTVIADCGALAPDDLPAHGHGDMLSFELSLGAQRIIVDQGVFEYIPGPLRAQSRAAASHNTLAVDGADQADFFGAFRFGRRARIRRCQWQTTQSSACLAGAHDGYAILPGRPHHHRDFEIDADGLSLRDRLLGTEPSPGACLGFLLHPHVSATSETGGVWHLTTPEGEQLRITCSAPLSLKDAVWWPDMGREMTTRRLTACIEPGWDEIITRIDVLPTMVTPDQSKVE